MTVVKRLQLRETTHGIVPEWFEVDVPEGPDEMRTRVVSWYGAHVSDPTDILGSLNEKDLAHVRRVELAVRNGNLDSVRWELQGNPESRALHCSTYATAKIQRGAR